jgi:hypothetical protein
VQGTSSGLPLPPSGNGASSCGCSGTGNADFYSSIGQMIDTYRDGADNILQGWMNNIQTTLAQMSGRVF